MQPSLPDREPVVIVGCGPAGLFAACELLRHGITARIVDSRSAPHDETRGTVLQPAVLEILARSGLVEPFLRTGVHIERIQLLGPGLGAIATTTFAGIGSAYEFQCSLPQWRTEAILRAHLSDHGVEIEYDTLVTAVEDAPEGLTVTLTRGDDVETITAAYVLGAGGGHSVTRHSMHEHLGGETYAGRYLVADARLDVEWPPATGRVVVSATGFGLFSPLPDHRWLIFVNRDETDTRTELPTEAELDAMLGARVGVPVGLTDLRWCSYFTMQKRAAEKLSDGRRFLLGDAGHLSSPLGGEGLNTAIMDAADIGWKLALVIHGAAKPDLLHSYATERGLASQQTLEESDQIHRLITGLSAMCVGGYPTVPQADPAQSLIDTRKRTMLDVCYDGSALVGCAGAAGEDPGPGRRFAASPQLGGTGHHLVVFGDAPDLSSFCERWGDLVTVVDGSDARFDEVRSGLPVGGAVLVRPDGFIGFCAAPATEATMKALDDHLTAYLIPERERTGAHTL